MKGDIIRLKRGAMVFFTNADRNKLYKVCLKQKRLAIRHFNNKDLYHLHYSTHGSNFEIVIPVDGFWKE